MSAKPALLAFALLAGCATAPSWVPLADAGAGQRAWAAACEDNDEWDKAGPPFRVAGNTYYVGTCGITSLLIAGPKGLVVIDSGTDKGADVVIANIRALGFDPRQVKTIFLSHEHFDHVGGIAKLQAATGATIVTTPEAAAVLRTGRVSPEDPQANSGHPPFPPVTGPIVQLRDEQPRETAGLAFGPMLTPGHTWGATSWRWMACEPAACRVIVYADSLNPISSDGYRFSDHPALVTAMRAGLAKVAASDCDIVLAPHPGAVAMRARLLDEKPLVDQSGCRAYAATATDRLDKRLASEAAGG
jgi:metallo-beta-lactamase class B